MSDIKESFSLNDCTDWNNRFDKASVSANKKEVVNLLSEANKLYLDEYYIYTIIYKLNNENLSESEKNELISNFNKSKIVKFVDKQNDYTTIYARANCIKFAKLSDIIPDILKDKNDKNSVVRQDKFSSEYLSQLISFPNNIVTGYVYGICDKSKAMHTWLEFNNNHNQEFVVDYNDNTVYNREGYYFLKHVEPLKKVSSDELKGKSSVSKSDTSEISNEIIDIEFDMGDER